MPPITSKNYTNIPEPIENCKIALKPHWDYQIDLMTLRNYKIALDFTKSTKSLNYQFNHDSSACDQNTLKTLKSPNQP